MSASELSCAELVELVTEYLDGVLPPTERARFEAHLADCGGCDAHLDQVRRTIELAGRSAPVALGPEAERDLLAAFRGWRRSEPA